MGGATVYQKHRAMQTRKGEVYGLTPARCWKIKWTGASLEMKSQ